MQKKVLRLSWVSLAHSSFSVSGSEEAQMFTLRAAKALAMTAADVLLDPALLEQVREQFREAKRTQEQNTQ